MRVRYVTMVFPAPSETFVCTEIAALRERGVDVSVAAFGACPRGGAAMLAEHSLGDVPVDALTAGAALDAIGRCLSHPWLTLTLAAFATRWCAAKPAQLFKSLLLIPRAVQLFLRTRADRPDVVHLFWGHYPSLLGRLVLDALPDVTLTTSLAAYDLRMGYGAAAPVARRASFVRTWAGVNVPAIEALGVDTRRIAVVHQLIDCDRRADLAAIAKTPRRLVTAARLIPAKGTDDALRVFAAVHAQWPDASLVVLGDGPERGRLETLARALGVAGAVTFRGHVPYAEVLDEMARAEVFIFMSHHPAERLPNVVKEAILARCACVVTDTPGIDELVRDGEHGHVVAPHDVRGATARVGAIFAGETDAEAMRARALDRLRTDFDADRVIPALIDRWRAACGERVPPG